MTMPVNYEPSGVVAQCRYCQGGAYPAKHGDVVDAGKHCYEPVGAVWKDWMCRRLYAERTDKRKVTRR